MKGVEQMHTLRKKAEKAEATTPAVGEVMYDRKRDARRAVAKRWATMTPEERMAQIEKAGGVSGFMDFMGKGESND